MELPKTGLSLKRHGDNAGSKVLSSGEFNAGLKGFLAISRRSLPLRVAMSIRRGVLMMIHVLKDIVLQDMLNKPDKTLSLQSLGEHLSEALPSALYLSSPTVRRI